MKKILYVEGMVCNNCVSHVTEALLEIDGAAWQVVWYENGEPRGPMTRYTGYDASIYDYVARYSEHFKHKNIGADRTEHLFHALPASPDAHIRVEVRDRFGRLSVWESGTGYSTPKKP